MGTTISLLLMAAGAALRWAVNATPAAVNLNVLGLLLMVVGAIGLVVSIAHWSSWGGIHRSHRTY